MKGHIQADKAYAYIRDQLLSGNLEPGVRLAEQHLSEAVAVNRGDVRQAFSRLLAEGLVVRGERGGVFVREYSEEDLKEAYEVRQILETAAAELAVHRAEEKDLKELEETAEHMLLMAENGYSLGVGEADLRFHNLLVRAAHNKKLHKIYVRANIPLSGINHVQNEQGKGLVQAAEDHIRIAEGLRNKDIDAVIGLLEGDRKGD